MIEKVYKNFKEEAELFFVKRFIDTPKIAEKYKFVLDAVFNVTKTVDASKGVILNGNYGQGKSFVFDVINHRTRRIKGKNQFVRTSARELCDIYLNSKNKESPEQAVLDFIRCKELMIDDIGDELADGRERVVFGNRLNVVRYVLLKRYEFFSDSKKRWRTHGTTNLTQAGFAENYGGRVSDRVAQMCHLKNFQNIQKGSFRQLEETRILTKEEIEINWQKFKVQKEEVKIDLEKYFNELIQESEEYIQSRDLSFWGFVLDYLLKKGLMIEKDFEGIDEQALALSEMKLKEEARELVQHQTKHAPVALKQSTMAEYMSRISSKKVYNTARVILAKRKFIQMREENHKF